MIAKLLRLVAKCGKSPQTAAKQTGLEPDHPLLSFFKTEQPSVEHFLALDDTVVMGAIERMTRARDAALRELASRLRERRLCQTLDVGRFGLDEGKQQGAVRRIDRDFANAIQAGTVIKDIGAAINSYTRVGGDDERAHKKLHIIDAATGPIEITAVSKLVETLREKKHFTRYFFENEAHRDQALQRRRELT